VACFFYLNTTFSFSGLHTLLYKENPSTMETPSVNRAATRPAQQQPTRRLAQVATPEAGQQPTSGTASTRPKPPQAAVAAEGNSPSPSATASTVSEKPQTLAQQQLSMLDKLIEKFDEVSEGKGFITAEQLEALKAKTNAPELLDGLTKNLDRLMIASFDTGKEAWHGLSKRDLTEAKRYLENGYVRNLDDVAKMMERSLRLNRTKVNGEDLPESDPSYFKPTPGASLKDNYDAYIAKMRLGFANTTTETQAANGAAATTDANTATSPDFSLNEDKAAAVTSFIASQVDLKKPPTGANTEGYQQLPSPLHKALAWLESFVNQNLVPPVFKSEAQVAAYGALNKKEKRVAWVEFALNQSGLSLNDTKAPETEKKETAETTEEPALLELAKATDEDLAKKYKLDVAKIKKLGAAFVANNNISQAPEGVKATDYAQLKTDAQKMVAYLASEIKADPSKAPVTLSEAQEEDYLKLSNTDVKLEYLLKFLDTKL
jgi:hypothetical protein